MSRFKALANKDVSQPVESAVVRRSLGNEQELFDSATYAGPYTESSYSTFKVECSADKCKERLLSIINPDYNLTVGYHSSFPYEILFSEIESSVVDVPQEFWRTHEIATDRSLRFECPACGKETLFAVCTDGGILISQDNYSEEQRPIPKNRVKFLTTPRKDWNTKAP